MHVFFYYFEIYLLFLQKGKVLCVYECVLNEINAIKKQTTTTTFYNNTTDKVVIRKLK